MAISMKRYVDIVSGVGGGAAVRQRDLILRLFTTSPRVPADAVVEMTNAPDVALYFGAGTPEALRAAFYFGFVSKNITAPKRISFGRYANAAAPARIYGARTAAPLASFTAVTTGSLRLTLGGYAADITGVNTSAAASLAAVASALQTAIRAVTAGGVAWTGATVTYDAPSNSFLLVGGDVGASAIAVGAAATGTPLQTLLGWGAAAVFSPGVVAQTPVQALATSAEGSDNFGTFSFIADLTDNEALAVAQLNDTYNVKFHFAHRFDVDTEGAVLYGLLSGLSGVSLTFAPFANDFPELLPAAVLAATDYSRRNSTQNYMFQQAPLRPSVSTNAMADTLDVVRANYYGVTQTAGQQIAFYQRGVMCGLATDPVDMNTYANEMWLKDAAAAQVMTLLLALAKVSANAQGRSQLLAVLQSVVDEALNNGTISVGKPLSTVQKLYIGEVTGDDEAWQQVFSLGYWLDVTLQTVVTTDGRTEWKALYTLVYSKDDVIRKVDGSHILI